MVAALVQAITLWGPQLHCMPHPSESLSQMGIFGSTRAKTTENNATAPVEQPESNNALIQEQDAEARRLQMTWLQEEKLRRESERATGMLQARQKAEQELKKRREEEEKEKEMKLRAEVEQHMRKEMEMALKRTKEEAEAELARVVRQMANNEGV